MKVLQVGKYYPPYFGGMETHLYNLCMELAEDVDVEVLVSNTDKHTLVEDVEGIKVTRAGKLAEISSASICPSMYSVIKKSDHDIINLHCPNPFAEAAFLAANPIGKKIVVTYQSDVVKQKILARFYFPILKRVLRKADVILAQTVNYVESSEILSPFKSKIKVVPLGIDISKFEQNNGIKKEQNDVKKIINDDYIIFVGRLVYYKGLEYLISAMKNVKAKLVLIGDGPKKKYLQDHAANENVLNKVVFLSNVSDDKKVEYLFGAKLLVLPSIERSEAYGLVQLEAMACGKPVINTSIKGSGVTTLSLHNETGLTVPPKNSEALTEAINKLLNDDGLAEKMGCNGKARVNRFYNRKNISQDVLQIYRSLFS